MKCIDCRWLRHTRMLFFDKRPSCLAQNLSSCEVVVDSEECKKFFLKKGEKDESYL